MTSPPFQEFETAKFKTASFTTVEHTFTIHGEWDSSNFKIPPSILWNPSHWMVEAMSPPLESGQACTASSNRVGWKCSLWLRRLSPKGPCSFCLVHWNTNSHYPGATCGHSDEQPHLGSAFQPSLPRSEKQEGSIGQDRLTVQHCLAEPWLNLCTESQDIIKQLLR